MDRRVARPYRQMCVQCGDRGVGPAREHQVEKPDVTGLARRETGCQAVGFRQGRPRRHHVAFPHKDLGLAGVGQGKIGIDGDGPIKCLDRAGIEGQR